MMMIEKGLIMTVVAVAIVTAAGYLGGELRRVFSGVTTALGPNRPAIVVESPDRCDGRKRICRPR